MARSKPFITYLPLNVSSRKFRRMKSPTPLRCCDIKNVANVERVIRLFLARQAIERALRIVADCVDFQRTAYLSLRRCDQIPSARTETQNTAEIDIRSK